jgi:snurportin-1
MYAELLELKDDQWSMEEGDNVDDGLPSDLEDNWVALAPVPKGKRCLAVSYQSSGTGGEGQSVPPDVSPNLSIDLTLTAQFR